MAYGDISAAVDREKYDADTGAFACILKVANGIAAIWNLTTGGSGIVRTYSITESGHIAAVLDSWEFEPGTYGGIDHVCEVAQGIFLTAYLDGIGTLKVMTMAIASDGTITPAAIDTLITAVDVGPWGVKGVAKKGAKNVFVAVWEVHPSQDGFVAAITCDADGTNIVNTDNWEFQPVRGYLPRIAYISADIFAVSYTDTATKGQVSTFKVSDVGVITAALIDTQEINAASQAASSSILKLDGDLVALGYQGGVTSGRLSTFTIDGDGNISAPLDTVRFDIIQASHVKMFSLRSSATIQYFGVAYNDASLDDVLIRCFSCTSLGILSAEIDNLHLVETIGSTTYGGVEVQPSMWAFIWIQSPGSDGWISTCGIETPGDILSEGIHVVVADIEMAENAYGIRVERGRETELTFAPAGVAELTMDNSQGDFSPENAAGAYYPTLDLGVKIYIYERYDGVVYPLFTGTIEKIVPQAVPGDGGAEAFIICTDGTDDLNDNPIDTALRTAVQGGQLITDILDAASAFVGARDIDTGISTFEVAFFSSPSALKEIRSVEDQERGRFYIDVDGDAQFEDRHHRILNHPSSEYDFGEKLKDIQYEWSKRDLFNFFQLAGIQYTADPDNLYLWGTVAGVAGVAVVVPGNGSVTIWATFSQALASYTALVAGTHWNTNTEIDKSGTDTTASVSVVATQYGKAIKMKFTSTFAADSYLVVPDAPPAGSDAARTAIVMGKLYQEEVIQYEDEDATSQTAYGKKGMSLTAPFISDPEKLRTLAAFLKARFKDPQPMAIRVTVHGRTDWPTDDILKQVLSRKISDRITLASTLLGFDQDFYIEKVIHDWKQFEGKFDLDVTWVCSRASDQDDLVWLLETAGFGELEVATYLGY